MDETDVEQVTLALLDAATDKDAEVQEQVRKSMLTLGKQQPDRVLAMCQDYLLKHPKLVVSHRVVILQTIELIVCCRIEEISSARIKSIISLASDEMTRSKDVVPDWQQAASNILVAVGNKYINDIMEEILSKFQPGLLPHFFVVQTLANLSDSNVYGMVPFLNAILGTMLPMLSMAKQDNMKWVFSSALCHFSDGILEYLANLDKAPDPTVRKDTFSSEIFAAFDILFNNWLQSRESKLRLTVAEAVGSMCHLMASDKLEEQIPKLIPAILSLYKKNNEHYIISKSLCLVLDASVSMGSRVLETQLDGLLLALHQQVSTPVDFSNPPTAKNHNEVLRCFSLLANSFPDRLIMFVLQKLENSNERNRMGSLAVLRHLINSTTSTMESKKLLILASIRQPMADHSNKVKKRVVQVISAMAHHGYLELEGGELLVLFLVQHCALPDTQRRGQKPTDPEEVTNEALRTMCDNTLHLLTTTVGRLADVLWPKLLYFLTPSQFNNATAPLCKSLIVLGNKKKTSQEPSFNIDFAQEVNLPSPQLLLVRLLLNAAFPFSCRGHGAPSLSLLQILSVNIHPKTEALWEKEIPPLLSVLEGSTTESLDKKQWDEKLLKLLSDTLTTVDDDKWACQLSAEATRYLSTYNNALEEKSFLYRCIGTTLQRCCNKELVKKQLQEILLAARHSDAVEREGVALAVGLCANSHLEATLAKLEEFGKSDAFKKSPSIFNLLKERNDVEVEKVKSTLILCYGQVAFNAPPEKILTRMDQDVLRCISKHFNTKVREGARRFTGGRRRGAACFCLDYKDDGVDSLLPLKERLENPDHSVLYRTCSDLTKVMSKRLPQEQLSTLVFMLLEGLADSQANCCRASSVILNTLLKNRGGGLHELVPEILEALHVRLQSITEEQVRVAVGQTVLILASQHLETVIKALVNQPLPFDGWTSEMWMALGADPVVANRIFEMVIEKLLVMAPYVDQRESMIRGGTRKVATCQPLAMTCGLKELLLNGNSQEAAVGMFPQLFSCLAVRLGASVGVSAPRDGGTKQTASVHVAGWASSCFRTSGTSVAADALRILLARAELDEVMKRLDEDKAWDAMKEAASHATGVTLLARAMAKHAGPRLPAIVESLCPSLNNIYECQRITVTAFFSELLNHHVVTELMLIDVLMNNMMERISDPCCTVRMLAVRGLGNIATGSPEKVNKYAKELLAAMSSGMEEKDDPGKLITHEAMSGLSKVLLYLDKKNVHLLVVYIFMKIKPFLESENDEIRCASILLMGNLSKFGSGEPVFKDQIHNVLVSLLLHLVDPKPEVVRACKYSMRVCAPVVGSEKITAMFQNHLKEEKSLHYGEFINDLTKHLIEDFPGMLNFYHISVIQFFKSNWAEVRAGAAMFIGFLLGNLPEEHFSHLNTGTITKGLVMLLQDPDPVVRVKAAEAMGRFH
ncbi:maestro heat-like repeat-containing protein family member 1 [Pseudoliparis swirei]|uniref:maestro heat-like repeat-containing protein family member 1 n=1 Tax=Pseudoliparis swirei TaxID=2059687 RepID=UPI0024BD9FA0|nr:maestro heat-like repeat-containing protein family member 1 [Pseudoliparis swirei]